MREVTERAQQSLFPSLCCCCRFRSRARARRLTAVTSQVVAVVVCDVVEQVET